MNVITVLGSTGSIGKSTLDVLARHPERFTVFALTANTDVEGLYQQCLTVKPKFAVLVDDSCAMELTGKLKLVNSFTEVLAGKQALIDVSSSAEVDTVMAAIVGGAGLPATLAAVQAAKKVLLANKESLVMAGQLFMEAVAKSGAILLPIDSEHNAIFQCIEKVAEGKTLSDLSVERILLTGSGGPFRITAIDDLKNVTPDMACAHPNWSMGRKISVDSATLMNKGLELIEACWLFDTRVEKIEVVIHPQSIIHSMVQFNDGTTLAQMGNPDMRIPIAHALAFPQRIDSGVKPLDFFTIGSLDFERPDEQRFPALRLAREAFSTGKTAAVILSAANEIAVEAFLNGQIGYLDICNINEKVLNQAELLEPENLEAVLSADAQARALARAWL